MDLKHSFGFQISNLRKQRGLTQEKLAELSGLSVDFLSLIERGRRSPSFQTIERLAEALQVKVKELFNVEEYGMRDNGKKTTTS
jgi:transcriptional regulator with XRE-family HTH domain